MRKIVLFLIIVEVLFGVESIKLTPAQQDDMGITSQKVQKAQRIRIGEFRSKVLPSTQSMQIVDAKFSGVIEQIYVQNYASVTKNQPLLSIKSSELLKIQQEYIEQHLALRVATENYKRDERLEQRGVISHKRLLSTQKSYHSALTAFEYTKERLMLLGFDEERLQEISRGAKLQSTLDIAAPQSGEIVEIGVLDGEYVEQSTLLFKIYKEDEVFVDIALPLEFAREVHIGDRALIANQNAVVVSISRVADAASQSLSLRAKLESGVKLYVNGLYDVLLYRSDVHAWKIAKSSLVYKEGEAFVFKRERGGFTPVAVEIVSEESDFYLIEALLDEGDVLAVSATSALLSAMESEDE